MPITADNQGNIIDGHRCYRIYKKHKIKEVFVTVLKGLTPQRKRHLAVSLNANRRHLTMDKKKALIRQFLAENPKLSARYLGRLVGVDKHTAQDVKNAMIAGGEIPRLDEIEGHDGKVSRATGAVTPLRDIKRTLKELSEVSELPAVVTPKKVRWQKAKEKREEAAQKGAGMMDPANTRLVHCDFRDLLTREPWIERVFAWSRQTRLTRRRGRLTGRTLRDSPSGFSFRAAGSSPTPRTTIWIRSSPRSLRNFGTSGR